MTTSRMVTNIGIQVLVLAALAAGWPKIRRPPGALRTACVLGCGTAVRLASAWGGRPLRLGVNELGRGILLGPDHLVQPVLPLTDLAGMGFLCQKPFVE